jgi:hypothetical protein
LHDAADCKEDFQDLDKDIVSAVSKGIKKYMKYYTFMDASDIYYTALVLGARSSCEGGSLLYEIEDKETGGKILEALRDNLQCKYPEIIEPLATIQPQDQHVLLLRNSPNSVMGNSKTAVIQ